MSAALIGLGILLLAGSIAALTDRRALDLLLEQAAQMKGSPAAAEWRPLARGVLEDVALLGALLVFAGTALTARRRLAAWVSDPRVRLLAAASLVIAVQSMVAFHTKSFETPDGRAWFLDDDAMVSMRYAANLAAGQGLTWNVGEYVEGYTNFLWTAFMAIVHFLPVTNLETSLVVLLANIVLTVLLLTQVDRLSRRLGTGAVLSFAALVLVALSREVMRWSLSGLETLALAVLVTAAVADLARPVAGRTAGVPTLLAVALLPLVRADAIVLSGLILVVAFVWGISRRQLAVLAAAALVPTLLHLAFRSHYYGDWLPNTAYLKVARWDGRLPHGIDYVARVGASHAAVALASGAALFRLERRRAAGLAALIAGQIGYVAWIGGDAFDGARFLLPVLPVAVAVAVGGVDTLPWRVTTRCGVMVLLMALTPLLLTNRWFPRLPALMSNLSPSYGDTGNVRIGLWLRRHTSPSATVADYWAGSVFYFSGRPGVDLLGKTDRTIARMRSVCDDGLPGHNKFDFDHSLGRRRPEYLVAGFRRRPDGSLEGPSGEPVSASHPSGSCNMFGALVAHQAFRQWYEPNLATAEHWRSVYRRE